MTGLPKAAALAALLLAAPPLARAPATPRR